MKTFEEKAKDLMEMLEFQIQERFPDYTLENIIHHLKMQDKDTRHACAEAIMGQKLSPQYSYDGKSLITKEDAHNICMNTKGG